MKEWIVVCGEYAGAEKKAVNVLTAKMKEFLGYEVPVLRAEEAEGVLSEGKNAVILGTAKDNALVAKKYASVANGHAQGYAICVEKQEEKNTVYLAGNTAIGAYYATADFLGEYLPTVAISHDRSNFNFRGFFDAPFVKTMPEFSKESAPSVENRAIWTWGHCILDYRKFFENMSLLKLNEIVMWNDSMPINAKEVVECAHSFGIRVIFGFAWGWDTNCTQFAIRDCFESEKVQGFASKVQTYYENEILPTGADGIYFQSFTELHEDTIDGVNIAKAVTAWVNGIAARLYEKYPALEIQFGLHATSVYGHLDKLEKVDKRIKIVWEDCGAFPYSYSAERTEDFDETYGFTKKILALRGKEERFGAVLKAMTTLYWPEFKHIDRKFVLGEATQKSVDLLYEDRRETWKYVQAEWIKNAEYARKTLQAIATSTAGDTDVQLLVESGAFEKAVLFPVALAATMMWDASQESALSIEKAMRNPFVQLTGV